MSYDSVSAGVAMIEAADPDKARNIAWSSQFYESNVGGITHCFEAAKKTGKDQKCVIIVPATRK
ncbi:hypothetical protein DFI02_12911 [Rhizobium sp. PP-F2F-G20b]|nr:hypothetical protein DFI02_12911 [Rhizobium sp. PP-F2F-G20b]